MTFYNIIFQHNFSIILLKYCMSTKGNNSDNIIDVQHDNMNTSKLNIDVFCIQDTTFLFGPFQQWNLFAKYDAHNDDYRFLKHLD